MKLDDSPLRELRDESAVVAWLAAGLRCVREAPMTAERLSLVTDVVRELAASGDPILPPGVIADVCSIVLGDSPTSSRPGIDRPPKSPLPATSIRKYDDHVLGRLHVDPAFERGGAAACRFQGEDRIRALAFLLRQLRLQVGAPGVRISPGVLRGLASESRERFAERLAASLPDAGVEGRLVADYEVICRAVRQTPQLLSHEDLFELERGTATRSFGQRLALRQVLQTARQLADSLPAQPPRVRSRWRNVPTPLGEEDLYPVGGYTSLSTRGSVESLLHSQLAYMEREERPDLFDVKFLRDELLYYARDENQFLRPRRTVFVLLTPGLAAARIKDPSLPYQRIVLALGLLVAAVRAWTEWLTAESLRFEFVFLTGAEHGDTSLAQEKELLETIFQGERDRGLVHVATSTESALRAGCEDASRRSRCHVLSVVVQSEPRTIEHAVVDELQIGGPEPALTDVEAGGEFVDPPHVPTPSDPTPLAGWERAFLEVVRRGL